MEEFEEPRGYVNRPGSVKYNYLNNASYLEKLSEYFPDEPKVVEILKEADREISEIVPEYNIAQIKVKFDAVRFYIDMPWEDENGNIIDIPNEVWDEVFEIINQAEYDATIELQKTLEEKQGK